VSDLLLEHRISFISPCSLFESKNLMFKKKYFENIHAGTNLVFAAKKIAIMTTFQTLIK